MDETPNNPEEKPQVVEGELIESDERTEERNLTISERRFCVAITGPARGNIAQATKLAGRTKNWGQIVLNRPWVQDEIARIISAEYMTPGWAMQRLVTIAASSQANFITIKEDGEKVTDLRKAAALGALGQIKELTEETRYDNDGGHVTVVKVKVYDPLPAIALILRVNGLLKDVGNIPNMAGNTQNVPFAPAPGTEPPLLESNPVLRGPSGPEERQDGDSQTLPDPPIV